MVEFVIPLQSESIEFLGQIAADVVKFNSIRLACVMSHDTVNYRVDAPVFSYH